MQAITNNNNVEVESETAINSQIIGSHTRAINVATTTSATLIVDRIICRLSNTIPPALLVTLCQQQDQQNSIQKIINVITKYSYYKCTRWLFSYHKIPIIIAVDNANYQLAYAIVSILEKKRLPHLYDKAFSWLESTQIIGVADNLYHAIVKLYMEYEVANFQDLVPYFLQNKQKIASFIKYAIDHDNSQRLKQLLNTLRELQLSPDSQQLTNQIEELYINVLIESEIAIKTTIASNNIEITKNILEYAFLSNFKSIYLSMIITTVVSEVIQSKNYHFIKLLADIMHAGDFNKGFGYGHLAKSIGIIDQHLNKFNEYIPVYVSYHYTTLVDYCLRFNHNNAALAIIASAKTNLIVNKIERTNTCSLSFTFVSYTIPSLFWLIHAHLKQDNPCNQKEQYNFINMFDILYALGARCSTTDMLETARYMKAIIPANIIEIINKKASNPPSLVRLASVNVAKNILAQTEDNFNLEILKNKLAEFLPQTIVNRINTIEDLFSMCCT